MNPDGLRPWFKMMHSNAAEQALAADGAIACFSSSLIPRSVNADRAPQLKAIVILRRLRLKLPGSLMEDELRVVADL